MALLQQLAALSLAVTEPSSRHQQGDFRERADGAAEAAQPLFAQGQHLALAHGHAGAVPEALLDLRLLVVVVSAGTQWRAQLIFVRCQALQRSAERQSCVQVCLPASTGSGLHLHDNCGDREV